MKSVVVLITGAGAPGAPGVIGSLRKPFVKEREIRIIGVDINLDSAGLGMVDKPYLVPPAEDESFIPEILTICKKENVEVIFPLVTRELLKFAKHKKEFEKKGIKVSISDLEPLKIAINKYFLMKRCEENDIPVPRFKLVKNFFDFKKAVFELGYPDENVCFKPPLSNGMRGFRILTKKIDRLDILMNHKPIDVLTTYEDIEPILKKAKPFPELIVMEYLPGEEYSVDVFAENGKPIIAIPRIREKIKMGISFVGRTIKDKELIGYSERLVETLGLHGNVGFQFIRNKYGIPCVIECNPRLQGTVVLSVWSRVNLPLLAIKQALGEDYFVPEVEWEWTMVRYFDEVYYSKTNPKKAFYE